MKHLIEPLLEKYTDKDVRNVLEKCIVFDKEEMRQIPELRKQREFVYFLIAENEIKYIGQTKKIQNRISTHTKNKDKFDYAIFCITQPRCNLRVEAFLISYLKPAWNQVIPKLKKIDVDKLVLKFEPDRVDDKEIELTRLVLDAVNCHPRNHHSDVYESSYDVITKAMRSDVLTDNSIDFLQKTIIKYEELAREHRNEAIRLTKHIKLFESQIEFIEQHIIK